MPVRILSSLCVLLTHGVVEEEGAIIILIFLIRKLRHREVKPLTKAHTANEGGLGFIFHVLKPLSETTHIF